MQTQTETYKHPQPILALITGIVGFIGCVTIIVADLTAGFVVNDYNPISETISDLAAGQRSWILDNGIQVFAFGVIACSIGLYVWNLDKNRIRWTMGSILLFLLGVDIIIIARHNAYGDGVPTGTEIHIYLVYFLGIAFALITWLFANGFKSISQFWSRVSLGIGTIWLFLAPLFFVAPNSWNGAYERFLGLIMITWFLGVIWLLIRYRSGKQVEEMFTHK